MKPHYLQFLLIFTVNINTFATLKQEASKPKMALLLKYQADSSNVKSSPKVYKKAPFLFGSSFLSVGSSLIFISLVGPSFIPIGVLFALLGCILLAVSLSPKTRKPKTQYNILSVIGFVFSVLSLASLALATIASIGVALGILFSFAAVTLGVISLFQLRKIKQKGKKLSILGIINGVLPYLSLLVFLLFFFQGCED